MNIDILEKSLEDGVKLKEKAKKQIDKYFNYIPMYDIYSNKIVLINKEKLYSKMINSHYRFVDERILQWLKNMYSKTNDSNEKIKLKKSIDFIKNYNLKKLYNNSIDTMYKYSPEIGLDITICKRKSFIPYFKHLKPYYSKDELINLGLNMEIIKNINKETLFDPNKHFEICKLISKNDITSDLILNHTNYINQTNSKYFIKYYSLYGSYFMNKYLRNYLEVKNKKVILKSNDKTKSNLIYNFTNKLIEIIKNSPVFDNDYILYRFVTDDSFLKNVKIGGHFIETGFMSTTRDPFYSNKNESEFGFILLKIRVPKNIKGIGLNIEMYSHFKNEEEIILRPLSKFKLISKNEKFNYYHIDKDFEKKIIKKYELEYIETLDFPKEFFIPIPYNSKNIIDFLEIDLKGETILDKINYFIKNFTNDINEFYCLINDQEYLFNIHWYDSTGPYKKFYYNKTDLGFSITSFSNNGYVNFLIEIGETISINYYRKWNENMKEELEINDEFIIELVSKISYCFKIYDVIIHTKYLSFNKFKNNYSNNNLEKILDCFTFPVDYYNYLKFGIKRFKNISSVYPKFNYLELDLLKKKKINELYNEKTFNEIINSTKFDKKKIISVADLFIFIIENKFFLSNRIIKDLKIFYNEENNPFLYKYYHIETNSYLFNKKLIKYMPINFLKNDKTKKEIMDLDEYKNIYRKNYRS